MSDNDNLFVTLFRNLFQNLTILFLHDGCYYCSKYCLPFRITWSHPCFFFVVVWRYHCSFLVFGVQLCRALFVFVSPFVSPLYCLSYIRFVVTKCFFHISIFAPLVLRRPVHNMSIQRCGWKNLAWDLGTLKVKKK